MTRIARSRSGPDTAIDVGRRTRLTEKVQTDIIEALRAGNYLTDASAYANVSYAAANDWLARGRAELDRIDQAMTAKERRDLGLPPAARERPFAVFAAEVERARGTSKVNVMAHVLTAVQGGWVKHRSIDQETGKVVGETLAGPDGRLGLDYLGRVAPKEYGRRQLVEVTGPDGGPVEVDASIGAKIALRLGGFLDDVRAGRVLPPGSDGPRTIEGQVERPVIDAGTDDRSEVADGPDERGRADDGQEPGGRVVLRRPGEG